jgi:hypothetical protein
MRRREFTMVAVTIAIPELLGSCELTGVKCRADGGVGPT